MPTPRKYSTRTRAKAVGIAVVEGVTAAERQTGIPKNTIQYWTQKPEFVHLRTTAREDVIEQLWIGIQVGIEEVTAGLRGTGNVHHKAMALQTLAERYALLTGGATARTEARDITGTITDVELAAAITEAESVVAGSRSPDAPSYPSETE